MSEPETEAPEPNPRAVLALLARERQAFQVAAQRYGDYLAPLGLELRLGVAPKE